MMFAKFNKSNLVTYLGVLFGVLAMYFSFSKMAFSDVCYVRYALACLVASGVCDMFDGKFARMFKRTKEEKEFGVQLDSLCDTFCFLAVPVVFMMSLGMTNLVTVIICTIFMLCGVSRLGYFNIKSADSEKAIKTYQGLPVTSTAATFPLLGLAHNFVSPLTFEYLYLGLPLLTAILMVVNIKIPKFKGNMYYVVAGLAVILIILLLVF